MATTYRDEIRKLTLDPGARRLAEIADAQEEKLKDLAAKVAACCDGPDIRPDPPPSPSERDTLTQ